MGFSSPEDIVNGWSRSQTHYKNLIDPDFNEIGVGMTSGLYNQSATTLVAQFFGAPAVQAALNQAPNEISASKILTVEEALIQTKTAAEVIPEILGQKVNEKTTGQSAATAAAGNAAEPPATAAPQLDQVKSKIYVVAAAGQSEKIVRAEVYLTADAVKARVTFNNYFMDLRKDAADSGKWLGQTIIFKQDQEQIFNPVVLAVVTAEDRAGNKMTADLKWDNIKPLSGSRLRQYFFIKQHQSPFLKPMFDITSYFYKIILTLTSIALALNIFIEIKKQQPRLILSTLGLMALLIVLIIL